MGAPLPQCWHAGHQEQGKKEGDELQTNPVHSSLGQKFILSALLELAQMSDRPWRYPLNYPEPGPLLSTW